jgi:hypothetical protein
VEERRKIHHVFWTGGLDSSFRVIHLLRSSDELVQPHYVIRHEESTGNEINAMNNIRRGITKKYPDLRPKLLPTEYINEELIPANAKVEAAVEQMRKETRGIHEQYEILARYCKAHGIDEIDLTYERYNSEVASGITGVSAHFGKDFPFESFRNPHTHISKRQCYDQAKKEGWSDLLKMTSFCRRPRRNGKPCGTCGPCNDVLKESMGFRLPFISRVKANILLPFRLYYRNNYHKHDTHWFFRTVKRRFEHRM